MLNLDIIRGTRVYQEAEQEGRQKGKLEAKFEIVPKLLEKGLTIQEVSELLDLDIESVRKAAHWNINM